MSATGPGPEPDWARLTRQSLAELERAPAQYQPTNFWGPALDQLLGEMDGLGLDRFKSWPAAHTWFYPVYRPDPLVPDDSPEGWATRAARSQALRDFDVARAFWDRDRWPFDLDGFGESPLGSPPERLRLLPGRPGRIHGRAYLNYLLCLSALSRHVEQVPSSFLEIGGGYGALGEILLQRRRRFRYVNLDIPPLLTVSSWYLWHRFPRRDLRPWAETVPPSGAFTFGRSGALPNHRVEDLRDRFDVFVNTFSFQEMEPDVVEHYVRQVCGTGITYAVSLNSRSGKPKAAAAGSWGALDPVRSDDIVGMFARHGFEPVGRYGAPVVRSQAELVVLARPAPTGQANS